MKVNTIMEKYDYLDWNRHRPNTEINNFAPPLESYNEEGDNTILKLNNNLVVVLS